MIRTKSEDAVSPVIGVMLMLVVTIIIAAVVAVFASGVGMDAEPVPATVVDVVGVTSGFESAAEWGMKDAEFGAAMGSGVCGFESDEQYYYYTANGERFVKIDIYTGEYTPIGNTEYRDMYMTIVSEEVRGDSKLILECLNGDILDLSKVSIKIQHSGTDNTVYEAKRGSLSGTMSPGDRQEINLGMTTLLPDSNRVDVVVYYGDHVITEEEKLKVN